MIVEEREREANEEARIMSLDSSDDNSTPLSTCLEAAIEGDLTGWLNLAFVL